MMSTNFGPLVGLKMNDGGKVDLARRGLLGLKNTILGLKNTIVSQTENLPTVVPTSPLAQVAPKPAPDVVAPLAQFVQKAAETPMSRREFLKKAGNAALSQAAKGILPAAAKEVVGEAIKSAAPAIDEAAAANKIADYVAKVWGSSKAAQKAFKQAHGKDFAEYYNTSDLSEIPHSQLWADVEAGNPENLLNVTKAIGLDLETVAKRTGLPLEAVKKIAGKDGSLLDEITGNSSKRAWLEQILEDGRPKEARRETSYLDLFDDEFMDETAKNALKELGHNADEMDLVDYADQAIQKRWREIERGERDPAQVTPLQRGIANKIVDNDTLDSVWEQATDMGGDSHIQGIFEYLEKHGWTPPR